MTWAPAPVATAVARAADQHADTRRQQQRATPAIREAFAEIGDGAPAAGGAGRPRRALDRVHEDHRVHERQARIAAALPALQAVTLVGGHSHPQEGHCSPPALTSE